MAEPEFYVQPSLMLSLVADDNLFYDVEDPERDVFFRLRPQVDLAALSASLSILGRYNVDAERYKEHTELDSSRAREEASVDVRFLANPRLTLAFDGSYLATQQMSELNREVGVSGERLRATRTSVRPVVSYELDPLMTGSTSYESIHDEVDDGVVTDTRTFGVSLARQIDPQNKLNLDYRFSEFQFDDPASDSEGDIDSHVVLFGGSHEFDARTTLTAMAGPRFIRTQDSADAELSVSLRYALQPGEFSVTYNRSQSTAIGVVGLVATESVTAMLDVSMSRDWTIHAAAGWYGSERDEFEVDVYQFGVEASYRVSDVLSLVGSYQLSRQYGSLDRISDESVSRNEIAIRIVARAPTWPRATSAFSRAEEPR